MSNGSDLPDLAEALARDIAPAVAALMRERDAAHDRDAQEQIRAAMEDTEMRVREGIAKELEALPTSPYAKGLVSQVKAARIARGEA